MDSSATASLQQQMHTLSNFSSSVGSNSNLSTCSTSHHEDDNSIVQCPLCDTKLKRFEVAKHCEQEMQRLKEMQTQNLTKSLDLDEDEQAEEQSSALNGESTAEKRKQWTVFQRVQKNRQSRMKQRTRKRPAAIEHPCPVCNLQFPQDEIQHHAEVCLRRSNRTANGRSNSDDHSSNSDDDGGGGEEYEEYEWAGQKRIRVSSLLQGGYAAIGIGQPTTNGSSGSGGSSRLNGRHDEDDDDEDLNVDEDDTQIYGPAQYAESDVIPSHILNEDESDVTSYMRRLITGSSSSSCQQLTANLANTSESLHTSLQQNDNTVEQSSIECSNSTAAASNDQPSTPAHFQQVIDSLKAKLRLYEQQHIPNGKYKCLICLDDYRNPAISVACWHVHCEQCWLRSLGARKLCPQCNLITTPKDLRRIYM